MVRGYGGTGGDARETGISLREAKESVSVLVLDNPEMTRTTMIMMIMMMMMTIMMMIMSNTQL